MSLRGLRQFLDDGLCVKVSAMMNIDQEDQHQETRAALSWQTIKVIRHISENIIRFRRICKDTYFWNLVYSNMNFDISMDSHLLRKFHTTFTRGKFIVILKLNANILWKYGKWGVIKYQTHTSDKIRYNFWRDYFTRKLKLVSFSCISYFFEGVCWIS